MVICRICKKEMNTAAGCVPLISMLYHNKIKSIPYDDDDGEERCHDCGAKKGNYHHNGCDMERCPKCKGQLISCGCEYK